MAGVSLHSGLPLLIQAYLPQITYEGDNTVMMQACAQGIVKTLTKIMGGTPATGYLEYLNDAQALTERKCTASKVEDFDSIEALEEMMLVRAAYMVGSTAMRLATEPGDQKDNWNEKFQVEVVNMT